VPTTRPRHTLTETDEIADALRVAAQHWPEDADRPGRLLSRLIASGRELIAHQDDDARERRAAAIRDSAGALTGVFEPGYRERLRDEWPD
jgi:hypothetical protein